MHVCLAISTPPFLHDWSPKHLPAAIFYFILTTTTTAFANSILLFQKSSFNFHYLAALLTREQSTRDLHTSEQLFAQLQAPKMPLPNQNINLPNPRLQPIDPLPRDPYATAEDLIARMIVVSNDSPQDGNKVDAVLNSLKHLTGEESGKVMRSFQVSSLPFDRILGSEDQADRNRSTGTPFLNAAPPKAANVWLKACSHHIGRN